MSIIEIDHLAKNFGSRRALSDINLCVDKGEVHGFLGPNGAGKSTTIRILLGLLRAASGNVRLFGEDPWKNAPRLHRHVAYVPGDVSLWPTMTGGEVIDFLASLRGGINEQRRADLIERFALDPTQRSRHYSKGNRQKVALISAFASDASLLILDEPTSGLDPLMEVIFQEEILAAVQRGVTVLLSSHILAEVETLADRVTIVRSGTTVCTGTIPELREHAAQPFSRIDAHLAAPPAVSLPSTLTLTYEDDAQHSVHIVGTVLDSFVPELVSALSAAGVRSLSITPPSLEELFVDIYRDDDADNAQETQGKNR